MEIETITPAKARQYLATRASNRRLSDGKVLEYAILMEQGRWVVNGETVKFDADGHLFDGQHRLEACILAEKEFRTYVVRDVKDPRAMATVDTGKARSHTDVWTIAGHKSAALVSSIASMALMYERGRLSWSGFIQARVPRASVLVQQMKRVPMASGYISKEELLGWGEAHINQLTKAAHFVGSSPVRKVMSPQAAGTLFYYAEPKHPVEIGVFLNDIGTGAGLESGDPALVLREHVTHRLRNGTKLSRTYVLGMMIKAWNARRSGLRVKILRVGEGEDFPKVK